MEMPFDQPPFDEPPPESAATKTSIASLWAGLKERTTSALIMMAILFIALLAGGAIFALLVVIAGLQMIREWDGLTGSDGNKARMLGLLYVGLPCASLIWLRDLSFEHSPNAGIGLVIYIMFVIWATDIGAYFTGRYIGGPKLAPTISPNKTWAGLGGGVVAAMLIGMLCSTFTPYPATTGACGGVAILLALVSQGGDLFESWLKRRVGAKDSGTLIPGHGGILDRVDGLVFASPLFALMVAASGLK